MNEKPTGHYRPHLATALADHLQEFADAQHPGVLKIHWDDCDCDDRRFWFHFCAPALNAIRQADSKAMKIASKLVTACAKEAKDFLSECPYSIEFEGNPWDRPIGVYERFEGRRYFDSYTADTWIKILSFQG